MIEKLHASRSFAPKSAEKSRRTWRNSAEEQGRTERIAARSRQLTAAGCAERLQRDCRSIIGRGRANRTRWWALPTGVGRIRCDGRWIGIDPRRSYGIALNGYAVTAIALWSTAQTWATPNYRIDAAYWYSRNSKRPFIASLYPQIRTLRLTALNVAFRPVAW